MDIRIHLLKKVDTNFAKELVKVFIVYEKKKTKRKGRRVQKTKGMFATHQKEIFQLQHLYLKNTKKYNK